MIEYDTQVARFYVYKSGGIGYINSDDIAYISTSFVLPVGFRPKYEVHAPTHVVYDGTWQAGWIRIKTDGSITILSTNGTVLTGTVQCVVNCCFELA